MDDGLTLLPSVVGRLYRMLGWYERTAHNDTAGGGAAGGIVPFEFRRFELAAALTPGGSADAYVRLWSDSADDYETKTDSDTFKVYDAAGHFRGRAKDAFDAPNDAGSRGMAWKPHDCIRWEIIVLQPIATLIKGTATTGSLAGTAIDAVTVCHPPGGIIISDDPAGTITLTNPHGWDWDNDARITAAWDDSIAVPCYFALEADCPAV